MRIELTLMIVRAIVCGKEKMIFVGGCWENAISKREEVFEQMGMTLVCAIRKFGWPDSKGRW